MHLLSALPNLVALATLATATADSLESHAQKCVSHSQPNPIASLYPGNVTGTINATIAILPIPMSLARSIIPKEYKILKNAWRPYLPNLPEDMYPALLQTVYDHDVRFGEYMLPDFSRASIDFPFVDLLSDRKTPFRWSPTMFLTSTAPIAIHGAEEYGTKVYPAAFDPPCNSYAEVPVDSPHPRGSTYFNAKAITGDELLETVFQTLKVLEGEFPTEFFVKATNQPSFADGTVCDEYIRFFNTSLSQGENAPVAVSGSVRAKINVFDSEMTWDNAVGMRVDTAFLENHLVSCKSLQDREGVVDQKIVLKTLEDEEDETQEQQEHGELR